jgi:hypothetical protein
MKAILLDLQPHYKNCPLAFPLKTKHLNSIPKTGLSGCKTFGVTLRTCSEDVDARIKKYWCSYTFYTSTDWGRTRKKKKKKKKKLPPEKITWRTSLLILLHHLHLVSNSQVIIFRLENRIYPMSLENPFPARCCLQNQEWGQWYLYLQQYSSSLFKRSDYFVP